MYTTQIRSENTYLFKPDSSVSIGILQNVSNAFHQDQYAKRDPDRSTITHKELHQELDRIQIKRYTHTKEKRRHVPLITLRRSTRDEMKTTRTRPIPMIQRPFYNIASTQKKTSPHPSRINNRNKRRRSQNHAQTKR